MFTSPKRTPMTWSAASFKQKLRLRVVKESSDSAAPPVLATGFIEPAPGRPRVSDRLALAVATCGVGYVPIAPGTWGAAIGVGIYLLLSATVVGLSAEVSVRGWNEPALEAFHRTLLLAVVVSIGFGGTWAASRAEPLLGRKDPGPIVVDEVVGQLIAFLFVPLKVGWWVVVTGFLLFRLFDIWKPYPINRLEALESGLGIMADDILAGAYAATLMSLLTTIYLLL